MIRTIISLMGRGQSGSLPQTPPTGNTDFTKNVRIVPYSEQQAERYTAFGFAMKTGVDRITYICREGISQTEPDGSHSYAHMYKGDTMQLDYQPSTDTWLSKTTIDTEPERDLSDCYGGAMDNGKYVYFSSKSPVAIRYISTAPATPGPAEPFLRIAQDDNLNWGARRYLFTDPGANNVPEITQSCSTFGPISKGDAPGEYLIGFFQFGYTAGSPGRGWCIKTLDNWQTWSFYQIHEMAGFSEIQVLHMGQGRALALLRFDQSPTIIGFKSLDGGHTWAQTGFSHDTPLTDAPTVIHAYRDSATTFSVLYQDRGTGFISHIRGITWENYLANALPQSELFYYNWNGETGGNPSLGYQCAVPWGENWFVIFAHENTHNDANLMYTLVNFDVDAGPAPQPPALTLLPNGGTSFGFRIPILERQGTGYTPQELQLNRWFEVDVATDAAFTQFVNAGVYYPDRGTKPMNGYRLLAPYIYFYLLATGQTYYVRVKAVNKNGSSAYRTLTHTL